MATGSSIADRKLLLILGGVVVALVAGVATFGPAAADNDPNPVIANSSPAGTRALFLALERMGRHAERWDGTVEDLSRVEAARTTVVLANPEYVETDRKSLAAALQHFLERGGRVVTAGTMGAYLLPDGAAKAPSFLVKGLCESVPQSAGALGAGVGVVEMYPWAQWEGTSLTTIPDQRCGPDLAVVHEAVGKGTAVWWAAPTPFTNRGLKTAANVRLTLASVGDGRDVLFLEELHSETGAGWAERHSALLWMLAIQFALLFLLLVLSLSRRRGPMRDPRQRLRTSPVEFAESMGALYARANATSAAVDAAKQRLKRMLRSEVGISAEVLRQESGDAVAEAVETRCGGSWTALAQHWNEAEAARMESLSAGNALKLVRALHEDEQRLRAAMRVPVRMRENVPTT